MRGTDRPMPPLSCKIKYSDVADKLKSDFYVVMTYYSTTRPQSIQVDSMTRISRITTSGKSNET